MDFRREASNKALKCTAREEARKTKGTINTNKPQTVNHTSKVAPAKKNEFTAFGKTYKVNDSGELVK